MAKIEYLKAFDKRQLFRFFIDGRFHKKYEGWVKYEEREVGSIQAMLNGFSLMMDNIHRPEQGLSSMYILELHKTCMQHVKTNNLKSIPGDIRYLPNGMPFFIKTTTLEHIEEVLEMRMNDNTLIFSDKEVNKTANELSAEEVYRLLQKKGKLIYRPWYPNIDLQTQNALRGRSTLSNFYDAKHYVQKVIISKMDAIVTTYNHNILLAEDENSQLTVIALLIRELELLHPFSDGNCRTFAGVLLNQLLLYHGFYPTIVNNPNLDAEHSLSQWVNEIKSGMEQTKILLNDPTAEVYNYSIETMPITIQNVFLEMASDFIKKIDAYVEVYITPEKLQKYTGGTWYNYEKNLRFNGIGNSAGNLSFYGDIEALKKTNKSVSQALNRIINNGVRAIVIDDKKYLNDIKIPVLIVDNLIRAYEKASAQVRQEVNPTTILITGTEGKTGTKIQLNHLLEKQAPSHAILNSANAKIPVLRTMINLREDHQYEIVEFSVDANEVKTVHGAQVVNPNICFFTNIGKEHMHNHKDIEGVIKAKSAVVMGIRDGGTCIVNASISVYDQFITALENRKKDINIITYGLNDTDTAQLLKVQFDTEKLLWRIKADIDGILVSYDLPLVQSHAPLMSVGVLLAVKECGLDVYRAAKDYANIQPYSSMGLMHKIPKNDGYIFFYDQSRRASISGVRSAFNDLANFKVKGKIVVLIGSISSVNENIWTQAYHEELAELINANSQIKKLYTTGSNMEHTHDNLKDKEILVLHSDDYDELYSYISSDLEAGDLIFVMGYMRLYLDKFAAMLLENKDLNPFDDSIYELGLFERIVLEYKKMVVSYELQRNTPTYVIHNHCDIEVPLIESLKSNSVSFRQRRMELLFSFFETINDVLTNEYNMKSMNEVLNSNGNSKYVYSKEKCNHWFNNLDKIKGESKSQLFGTFFNIDAFEGYCLFVLAGTVNLHIGIGLYVNNKMIKLTENDHDKIIKQIGSKLPSDIKFNARKWGPEWVTIDCGYFVDLLQAEVFSTFSDLTNSEMFKKKFDPLLQCIKVNDEK